MCSKGVTVRLSKVVHLMMHPQGLRDEVEEVLSAAWGLVVA